MKKILVLLLVVISFSAIAQKTSESIDVLKAPSSPAANLLGTSPSDVQQFTDPSAFMISLQKASSNYSSIPTNYAVDLAPAWLFKGGNIKYEDYAKKTDNKYTNISNIFKQTFVLSIATKTNDSNLNKSNLGLGLKFSFCRGDIPKATLDYIDGLFVSLSKVNSIIDDEIAEEKGTDEYKKADSASRSVLKNLAKQRGIDKSKDETKKLKESIKNINLKRFGFKLDFAGGLALDYPNQRFDSIKLNKGGVWITTGYEAENNYSFLALFRLLYNPDKVYADDKNILKKDNLTTFDVGGRLIFNPSDNKFNLSAEGIYRSVLSKTDVNPTWRFTLNAEYQVGNNKKVTLALGRDFDGTFNKDGNLIAAMNLVMGFGNNRPVH